MSFFNLGIHRKETIGIGDLTTAIHSLNNAKIMRYV